MTNYYRVRPADDQRKRYNEKRQFIGIYIANEVLTPREARNGHYDLNRLEAIQTSRKNVYWCFGVRFVDDETKVVAATN